MANYTSTSASTWYKIDSTNENQFNWKYATDIVYGNSTTYTTKVYTPNIEEEEMAASQSKTPVLHGLINEGLLGKSLETMVMATSTQIGKYLPNSGYYRINLTAGADPLSPVLPIVIEHSVRAQSMLLTCLSNLVNYPMVLHPSYLTPLFRN